MGLTYGASRRTDRKMMSLAEMRDFVNAAYAQLPPAADGDEIFPAVRTTFGGRPGLREIQIQIP